MPGSWQEQDARRSRGEHHIQKAGPWVPDGLFGSGGSPVAGSVHTAWKFHNQTHAEDGCGGPPHYAKAEFDVAHPIARRHHADKTSRHA